MDLFEESGPGAAAGNTPPLSVSEISGAVKRVIEGEFARVRVRGDGRVGDHPHEHVIEGGGEVSRQRRAACSAACRAAYTRSTRSMLACDVRSTPARAAAAFTWAEPRSGATTRFGVMLASREA